MNSMSSRRAPGCNVCVYDKAKSNMKTTAQAACVSYVCCFFRFCSRRPLRGAFVARAAFLCLMDQNRSSYQIIMEKEIMTWDDNAWPFGRVNFRPVLGRLLSHILASFWGLVGGCGHVRGGAKGQSSSNRHMTLVALCFACPPAHS